MSTLVTQTVQSKTSGPPVFKNSSGTEKGQLVKAWANIETSTTTNPGGSKTINGSFNISSCTDIDEGKHQITFTSAFDDVKYCVVATTGHNDMTDNANATAEVREISTTGFKIVCEGVDEGYIDRDKLYIAVFSA